MMIKRKPQTSNNEGLTGGLSSSVNVPGVTGRRNKLLHPPPTAQPFTIPKQKPQT